MNTVTEFCKGCNKINDKGLCSWYVNPSVMMRWINKEEKTIHTNMPGCYLNVKNVKIMLGLAEKDTKERVRVGQQKTKRNN